MPSYSVNADFEDIESPELIASSLSILQLDHWVIKDYTDSTLKAKKVTIDNYTAEFSISVHKKEVSIACQSELNEQANKFVVDSFVDKLHKFLSSPAFDHQIRNLKHHYFMNNPLQKIEEESTQKANSSIFSTVFSFRKNFRITPGIIIVNVFIFIIMLLSGVSFINPKSIELMQWGANFRSNVLQGEWWRLLSACFLHAGIFHILFNMWALFDIGFFLERMIGSWRFLFAYLIAGLAGSMNSIAWHFATPSVGASGAIFGMFGLFLALLTTNILEKGFRNAMLKSIAPMILFNLLIGTSAMIDNAGHIGGLLAGLMCGYLYAWHYKNPKNQWINIFSFVLPTILIITSGFIIHKKLPNTYLKYQTILKNVERLEKDASGEEKQIPYDASNATLIWDKAIQEIAKTKTMKLNNQMNFHNERVLFYLQKRKQRAYLFANPPANYLLIKKYTVTCDSIVRVMNSGEVED
jgi:rhomboid protease GluP